MFAELRLPVLVTRQPGRASDDIEVTHQVGELSDGSRYWTASASRTLSSGAPSVAQMTIDSEGVGEASLSVDGVIVARASRMAPNEIVSWAPARLGDHGELVAEFVQRDVEAAMIFELAPPEFTRSAFGREVMRVAAELWAGLRDAAGG